MKSDDGKTGVTMSRRCLLNCAGKLAVGSAAMAVSGGTGLVASADAAEAPYPWPYKKLDLEEVGEITYNRWYTGLCTNAVVTGIMTPLRKAVGEPYTSFPVDSFIWGHGGVAGWGTMCGTMLGAAICANLVCGPGVGKGGEQVANEVITYYQGTALPTFMPKNPKIAGVTPTSQSDSPLCHVSVGKWMKKTNNGFWSAERKDRCARLAANVAMRTAMHMNEWAEGKFKPVNKAPPFAYNITAQHNCVECHQQVPEVPTRNNPPPVKMT